MCTILLRPKYVALLLLAICQDVQADSDVTVATLPHMAFYSIRCNNRSNCTLPTCTSSVSEFPPFLSDEQLGNGALTLCFIIAAYSFTLIAIVCDSYFIPCIEGLCNTFKISQDVAAAVFMSMATSTPELCANVIGTFVTQSDIGLGTIVGSSIFNTLGVGALGSLAAAKPIQLDWWPLSRDVVIYITAILMLVTVTWDGTVHWWEALILTLVYIIYFIVMFQNRRISKFFRKRLSRRKSTNIELTILRKSSSLSTATCGSNPISISLYVETMEISFDCKTSEMEMECPQTTDDEIIVDIQAKYKGNESLFKLPTGRWYKKCLFYFTWPSKLLLHCSIPHPVRHPRLYPITFIMCIAWIAITSYFVSWMITIIGHIFGIPDSVLGLTFLAAGGCLPEAISIIIMSRKGEGSMGVSNALGANTMNILLSLGVPWLIKAAISTPTTIVIQSGSMEYIIMGLIVAAALLFMTLGLNGFRLSKRTGIVLGIIYICFVVLAVLSDLIFFDSRGCNNFVNSNKILIE